MNELIDAVDRCLVQHDYLHETFHMFQAIYDEYWGGFFQLLVSLMNRKRVSGDVMKSGKITDHHNFLIVVYQVLCHSRCIQFVDHLVANDIEYEGPTNTQA